MPFPLPSQQHQSTDEREEKYIIKFNAGVHYNRWELYLYWFPKLDSCHSSEVQLVRVQPGTPSRWSYTEDSLPETSCHAAVHIPLPRAHSLHAWTQGDSDSQLKSSAHRVHANIDNIQQKIHYQRLKVTCWNASNEWNILYEKNTVTVCLVHTSSISLIHRSMPSNDQRFVMSYTRTTPYKYTYYAHISSCQVVCSYTLTSVMLLGYA